MVCELIYLQSYQELKLNLEHPKISGETTVHNAITEVAAMMGENVKLRRGFVMSTSSNGVLSTYLHTSPQPGTVMSNCFFFFFFLFFGLAPTRFGAHNFTLYTIFQRDENRAHWLVISNCFPSLYWKKLDSLSLSLSLSLFHTHRS